MTENNEIEIATDAIRSADGLTWVVNLYINQCELRLAGKYASREDARGSAYNVRNSVKRALEGAGKIVKVERKEAPPPKQPGTMILGPLSQKCKYALFRIARMAGGEGNLELSEVLSKNRTFVAPYVAYEIEEIILRRKCSYDDIDAIASMAFTVAVAEAIGESAFGIADSKNIWATWLDEIGEVAKWFIDEQSRS